MKPCNGGQKETWPPPRPCKRMWKKRDTDSGVCGLPSWQPDRKRQRNSHHETVDSQPSVRGLGGPMNLAEAAARGEDKGVN